MTTVLATAIGVVALTGCGPSSRTPAVSAASGSFRMDDGQVVISASNRREARISPEGQLTIGGAAVAVTDGQRAQLVNYYNAASGVFEHAVATGAAGVAVGAAAASGVVSGLAKGDMTDMKAKVQAQADEVRRQAQQICDNLAAVRAAQDALAAQVEAFKPYAVVSEKEAGDCSRGPHRPPAT